MNRAGQVWLDGLGRTQLIVGTREEQCGLRSYHDVVELEEGSLRRWTIYEYARDAWDSRLNRRIA